MTGRGPGFSFRARHRPARPATAAFTLLELLIATSVGAIVLLVINGTFFGSLRLYNTTHRRIDTDLALQRTLGIIRQDLAGIMLPGGTLSGQLQTETFSSNTMDDAGERVTPDIYTSSGRIDGWTSFSDVQMVSYFLAPAPDGGPTKRLVRVVTRNLLPVQEPTTEEQTLLTGVESATMSFFDGSDWIDTWDSSVTSTLPSAIKFSLVMSRAEATNPSNDANPPTAIQPAPSPIELVVPVLVTTTTTQQALAAGGTATP